MKRSLAIVSVICVTLCCGLPLSGQDKSADKSPWEAVPIIPHKGEEKFRKIAFVTRDLGYIAGTKAVYKTTDAGKTWKPVFEAAFLNSDQITYLRFKDAKTGYLAANYKVYYTDDGGESWVPIEDPIPTKDLAFGPNGWLMAVGGTGLSGPVVMQKRGPTAKWESVSSFGKVLGSPESYFVNFVAITGPDTALIELAASFYPSHILRTTDGGKTWKDVFAKDKQVQGMQFVDEKHGWITARGSLWMTEDGGETWKAQVNPEDHELQFLKFGPSGSTFGVAPVSRAPKLVYTTTGKKWLSVQLDLKEVNYQDASVVDNKCAYVLNEDGSILRFLDMGK